MSGFLDTIGSFFGNAVDAIGKAGGIAASIGKDLSSVRDVIGSFQTPGYIKGTVGVPAFLSPISNTPAPAKSQGMLPTSTELLLVGGLALAVYLLVRRT